MEFEFNKFFFFVVFAFWILAESCYKTLKAKLGTNDFSIRILVFADFLQITKFEMSHLEKLDVIFNKFYFLVLNSLRVGVEICFKALKASFDKFISHSNVYLY